MKEYALFARRIGLVGITQTIINLRGLITLPILTKALGAASYGVLVQILVTVSLLIHFVHLGLGASLVRFLPAKEKKEISQGFITVLITVTVSGFIISLVLFFSSDLLAIILLKDISASRFFKIAPIFLVLHALRMVTFNSFRILGKIKRYSLVTLLHTCSEIILLAFFVLSGYGVFGAISAMILTEFIFLLVILILLINYTGFALPDFSLLRPYLIFSLPIVFLGVFEVILWSCDRYIIGYLLGTAEVGKYSAAYNLGTMALTISPFIIYILSPTIAGLYDKGNIAAVRNHLSYSMKYFLMISIPAAFGLSVLAKPFLSILTTSEFLTMSEYIVPFVASGIILFGIYGLFAEVIKLSKRTHIFIIVFFTASVLNLVLNFIFVPYFGIVGAAITTLISYLLVAAVIFYKSRQFLKFDIEIKFIMKCIFSSFLMALVIWFIQPAEIWEVILSITIGIIVYFIMLFILKGFRKEELRTIIKVVGLERILKIFH